MGTLKETGLEGPLLEQAERGLPLPEPPDPPPEGEGGQPASSLWVVPHFESFIASYNLSSRSYRWWFDQALQDSVENAEAYRNDPVVWEALRARQMGVAGLEWHVEPSDDEDPRQTDHAQKVTETLQDTSYLQNLFMALLEAEWYGRYGVQMTQTWDYSYGYRRKVISNHIPINGDKLVFRYSGEVGILVGSQYQGSWVPTDRGMCHFCSPTEREQLAVHCFEPEDASFQNAESAGRIKGVGLRDRLYWFLYMRARVLAWLMQFLERVGAGGLTVYFYESGNARSKGEVLQAAGRQMSNNSIAFPRYKDSDGGPGLMRIEPSMAGAQLLQSLVMEYFDNIIRRVILGQSLSGTASGTGLGSGVAEFHAETLNRITKYDARNAAETITRDIIRVLSKYINPGIRPPKFMFDVDKPNAAEFLEAAERFFQMGGSIDEDQLRSILGLRKPKPGAATLSKINPMNPQQMGTSPEGVPSLGNPGPEDMEGDQGQDPLDQLQAGPQGPGGANDLMAAAMGQAAGGAGGGLGAMPMALKRRVGKIIELRCDPDTNGIARRKAALREEAEAFEREKRERQARNGYHREGSRR